MFNISDQKLEELIRETQKLVDEAVTRGDGPFAALLVNSAGEIVLSASNTTRTSRYIVNHAEMNLLRLAAKLPDRDLSQYAVVVNAAPCPMCMSAMIKAKIQNYYYGAPTEDFADPYITPEEVAQKSKLKIKIQGGILSSDCQSQIVRGRELMAKRKSN